MRKLLLIFAVVSTTAAAGYAQKVTKVGTTAAGFLNIGVGAKAIAMGGAYVAVAADATAMFWNPAGIARLPQAEALFDHSNWIADINFDYAGIVVPLGNWGTLGANATFLTMDKMERTTVFQPEGTGETFDAGSYAFGLSYARNLTDRFSIGFNVKYVNEHIYHSNAYAVALDVGTLFTTRLNGMQIGMSISNFGTKMAMSGRDVLVQHDTDPTVSGNNENINANLVTDHFELPLNFQVGVSMDLLKGAGNSNLIVAVDALHPNDDVESINIGGEYVFNRIFSLRGGYKTLFARGSEEGFTLGAGLFTKVIGNTALKFDYAYQDFGVLENIQKFSVALRF